MTRLKRTSRNLSRKPLGKHKALQRKVKKLKRKVSKPNIKIPLDKIEFFHDVLKITPYPYQVDFLLDESPLKVLRWCRRAGKTLMMTGDDIHFAAHNPGATIITTMPKYNQIKEIYFQGDAGLHAHLARMPKKCYDALIYEQLQTIIRFKNGAKIIPETPEPFTIRGHGPEKINCIPGYVRVTLADGSQVAVSEVKPGQEVLTYNVHTREVEPKQVLKVFRNPLLGRKLVRIIHDFGFLDCTEDHKVFTAGKGFTRALQLTFAEESLYRADILFFRRCPRYEATVTMETCNEVALQTDINRTSGTIYLRQFTRRSVYGLAERAKTECSFKDKSFIQTSRIRSVQILDSAKVCENSPTFNRKQRLGQETSHFCKFITPTIHRNLQNLLPKRQKNYFFIMVRKNNFTVWFSDLVHGRWRPFKRRRNAHKHSQFFEERAFNDPEMAARCLEYQSCNKTRQKRKRLLSVVSSSGKRQILRLNQNAHHSKHAIQVALQDRNYSMRDMRRTCYTQQAGSSSFKMGSLLEPRVQKRTHKTLSAPETTLHENMYSLLLHILNKNTKPNNMQPKMQTSSQTREKKRIQQTVSIKKEEFVYDLEVEGNHNYFANGVLISNCDEFNFVRKDRDLWLSALLPMTLTRTVYINVASTPWSKDSVYWQMCFDKAFKIFSGNIHGVKGSRYLKTFKDVLKPKGPLDPRQVAIMQDQYAGDPWRWRREMLCEFVSDEAAFLPSSLIVKCQNQELEFAKFEALLSGNLFVGWDLGRERDPGVTSVIDRTVDVYRLVHCHQFPLGTPYVTQMGYIKSLCQRWNRIRNLYYDHTGTKGIDEQIEKTHFPGLVGVNFSKASKHGMAVLLKELMMTPRAADRNLKLFEARRQFEMPFDRDVEAELNVVQWEQTKGSELYTFSHPEGSNDDRFWSICLAVLAASKFVGKMTVAKGEKPW